MYVFRLFVRPPGIQPAAYLECRQESSGGGANLSPRDVSDMEKRAHSEDERVSGVNEGVYGETRSVLVQRKGLWRQKYGPVRLWRK